MAPDIDSATQLLKDGKIWSAVKGASSILFLQDYSDYTLQRFFFLFQATSRRLKTTWT